MKKTLIALALAALPVAAMADVTLYGQIKGGLEFTKVKGVDNTITNVNDWGSRIGFKGEEDLGNGLKTIWQVEQYVSLDTNSGRNSQWASRDSFIGLATPFGTVRAGHLSDQFNSDMDTLDPWEGTGIRTLGMTFGRTSDRYTGVRYDTPEFAGFQANLLWSPEDNTRYDQARGLTGDLDGFAGSIEDPAGGADLGVAENVNALTVNNQTLAVGLNYQNSGFFAKYGFKMIKDYVAVGDDAQVHRVEGGYDANNLFVGLGFQYTKDYEAAGVNTKEAALTAAYTLGNLTPRVTYAHGFDDEYKYDQAIVGVDYALSKRTTVLANVAWMRTADTDLVAAEPGAAAGAKNSAYSVGLGLRHKF